MDTYDISVVLGSKNRKNLLKATIDSIRENGFDGKMEIIVVDGGSTDGTCDWLAGQRDILTIVQPNYSIRDEEGISVLRHSWGEFMNLGFRQARAPWAVMVSDDLILTAGVLRKGLDTLNMMKSSGRKIGGGAFFFREYPRHDYYRVHMLPGNVVNINHGFYNREALVDVDFTDGKNYNFYCADGDLALRMHQRGWEIITLDDCFAEHLTHIPRLRKMGHSPATLRDIGVFAGKYPQSCDADTVIKHAVIASNRRRFWRAAFMNCFLGVMLRVADRYSKRRSRTAGVK